MGLAWVVLVGCKKPPEAPKELEDLAAFLFAHVEDEDDVLLEDAVANLGDWLEHGQDELAEGYTVDSLPQSALDELDDRNRAASDVVGAAIDSVTDVDQGPVVSALVVGDQMAIYPDTYDEFVRTFDEDPACFVEQECPRLAWDNESVATLPLGIELDCQHRSQDRWVDWDGQKVLVHRSWLKDPTKGGILELNAQYFVAATFPWDNGTLRMQALWADAEIVGANVPQATLLNMLVKNLQDLDEELYDYAAENAD